MKTIVFEHYYQFFKAIFDEDEYKKKVPDNCGVFCSHNPYGLGAIMQTVKSPKLVDI